MMELTGTSHLNMQVMRVHVTYWLQHHHCSYLLGGFALCICNKATKLESLVQVVASTAFVPYYHL